MARHRPLLATLLLAFVALAVAYSTLVPLGEAPDEVSHYAYVRWLATQRTLPPPDPDELVFGEVFQPPLYYALAAPLTAWLPTGPIPVENNPDYELADPVRRVRLQIQHAELRWPWHGEALAWHIARFAAIPLGLISVLATFFLAKAALPHDRGAALVAAAFVAFLPQFVYLNSVVSNDPLIIAISAALLAVLAPAIAAPERHVRRWLLVGLLGGLAVWTKSSGWLLAGSAGLAWLLTWQQPQRWQRLAALAATWLFVALPWLLITWQRSGDLLGVGLLRQVTEAQPQTLTPALFQSQLWGLYQSIWLGVGGAAHNTLPPLASIALALPLVVGALGLGVGWRRWSRDSRRLLLWLIAHLGLLFVGWMQWSLTVLGTGQGRLIFPALPALAVLMTAGWRALWPSRRAAMGMLLGFALFSALVLAAVVGPLYRGRPALAAPVAAVDASWQFGDGLTLLRYEFTRNEETVAGGTPGELYVEWLATQPLPDLRMRLHLVDETGAVVWQKEGTPSAGWDTTDVWPVGEPIAAWHRVVIPVESAAGWHRLLLSVVARDGDPLPIRGPDGTPYGDQVAVGGLWVE